jgi:hypothetical protein
MDVLLLAHEGHQHGPDLGLVALLIAGAVLAVLLLAQAVRASRRTRPHNNSASNDAARAAPSDSTGR